MGGVGVVYPKSGSELNFLNVHQMILEDRKLFRQSSDSISVSVFVLILLSLANTESDTNPNNKSDDETSRLV